MFTWEDLCLSCCKGLRVKISVSDISECIFIAIHAVDLQHPIFFYFASCIPPSYPTTALACLTSSLTENYRTRIQGTENYKFQTLHIFRVIFFCTQSHSTICLYHSSLTHLHIEGHRKCLQFWHLNGSKPPWERCLCEKSGFMYLSNTVSMICGSCGKCI